MTVLAKLFFLGIEKEVQNVQIVYQRIINHKTGRPTTEVQGGYLQLSFESSKDDEVFEYYSGKPSERIPGDERFCFLNPGELVFYPGSYDNPPVKRYTFSDATITNIRVKFTATGESSMTTCITISPAIQNYGALLVKNWNESYLPQSTDNYVPQNEEEEKKEEVKCIAWLERLETYKGEFGLDWMRDNYKDICENYEELKKEYEQITIEGETYFVPWLSMFPNQENVSLNLKVKITEGKPKNDDVIKLPSKNGIRFEPNEVKIKDIQKGEVTIKVFCDTPLNKDTKIELLDKENHTVGKITVVKNDEELILPIQFVKVLGNESNNTYNERTFDNFDQELSKIDDDLSNKYFNQALIIPEVHLIKEMIVDINTFVEKQVLTLKYSPDGSKGIPNYQENFDDELYKLYVNKWGEFKGIIVFLSAMHQSGMELGHARIFPRTNNFCLIAPDSIWNSLAITHEVAHSLGLYHPSTPISVNDKNINLKEQRIKKINDYLESNKEVPDNVNLKSKNISFGEYKRDLIKEKEEIAKKRMEKLEHKPKYVFDLAKTENIMDYNGYKKDNLVIYNPKGEGVTFWNWQSKIMSQEIKLYHGK